jgi:hypothetical protein
MRMVRITLALVVVVFLFFGETAGSAQWTKKKYHVLVDGNELFEMCGYVEKHVHISGDRVDIDGVPAATCWAYVEAVVDSIPGGEGFEPNEDVRLSQYVDTVFKYLKDHPESRHLPAYYLVRTALTEAFPGK